MTPPPFFRVQVLSDILADHWTDMGDHASLAAARVEIDRLRRPLTREQRLSGMRSMEGRRFRVVNYVPAAVVEVAL